MMKDVAGPPPQFSIILPTHNRADVLPFAIRSVLGQTLEDFELLIVGDGCTDQTAEVVRSFADPRIVWFDLPKAPNFGYANRNIVFRQTRGEYIACMAHDDLWLPDHLELLFFLLQESGIELAYSCPVWVIPEGKMAPAMFNLKDAPTLEMFLTKAKNRIPASCMVHRRACFEKYGYWNEALPGGGDWDMWIRIILGGERKNFAYLPEPTCLHFRADWRKRQNRMLDHEVVWERLYGLEGFLPAPLKVSVPEGMTEQEAVWQVLAVSPPAWSKQFRAAIRQALELRVAQSDELLFWLVKHQPALAGDTASVIKLIEGLWEPQAALDAQVSNLSKLNSELRVQVRQVEQALEAQRAELARIKGGRMWKLALLFWRVRWLLAPPGSRRSWVLKKLYTLLDRPLN